MVFLRQSVSLLIALFAYSLCIAQETKSLYELYENRQDSIIISEYSEPKNDEEKYYVASTLIRQAEYELAKGWLQQIVDQEWYVEAQLSLMRVHFFQKNYATALEIGHRITGSITSATHVQRAHEEIQAITQFISPSEAYQLFIHSNSLGIKSTLLESQMYAIPYSTAQKAYEQLIDLYEQQKLSKPLVLSRIERQLSNPI
ncbi:MAG: hypothetical protein VW868_07605, partial [Bacteroidota bacterium]